MIDKLFSFFKRNYQTLNRIDVSKANLLHNFHYLSNLDRKIKIAPVVKSNGYGHGITNVGKILDSQNAPYFCVDSLYEAYELQKAKIKTPVLVMGYTNPVNLKIKKLPFSFAVYDLETAEVLNEYQKGCKIHVFVDTGMRREGVTIDDLPNFLSEIKKLTNIEIEGLMSHLASSESNHDPLFLKQINEFKKAKEIFKEGKINLKWIHTAATGSLTNPKTRPAIAEISNLARAGLALYGFSSYSTLHSESRQRRTKNLKTKKTESGDPSLIAQDDSTLDLKPALTLTSKIVQIKKVKKGEKIGYDGTYSAKTDLRVGVLPIGYYDGVDRRLSNKGVFLVKGIQCPILGRVSMNVNIIDLSKIPSPKVGEEVVVYSANPKDKNSISNCAKICNTIPYDLLVNLAETTRRVIV